MGAPHAFGARAGCSAKSGVGLRYKVNSCRVLILQVNNNRESSEQGTKSRQIRARSKHGHKGVFTQTCRK
jgi:hypothetical protein